MLQAGVCVCVYWGEGGGGIKIGETPIVKEAIKFETNSITFFILPDTEHK